MSAYTITVMVRRPGCILPEIMDIRNVRESVEKLLGGAVHVDSFDHPIPGVVMIVGPEGRKGSVLFAGDGGKHWGGLGFEQQKRVMAWHLKGGVRSEYEQVTGNQ